MNGLYTVDQPVTNLSLALIFPIGYMSVTISSRGNRGITTQCLWKTPWEIAIFYWGLESVAGTGLRAFHGMLMVS